MAPTHHLLRATLPLRSSIASVMTPTRSALLAPSVSIFTTSLRSASTTTTPDSNQPAPSQPEPTQTSSSTPSNASPSPPPSKTQLKAPPRIRNYTTTLKIGTVVSVGLMDRTVRVCHRHTEWDRHIEKYYPKKTHYLVADPRNSLREGDVIEFSSGAPKSRRVHHVVERIVTPFGLAIEDRPPIMSREEREQERERRWVAKYLRRESRRLGRDVDLLAEAGVQLEPGQQPPSAVELIHRIHGDNERVGKVKRLVMQRSGADSA